jgi:hypothetical protein
VTTLDELFAARIAVVVPDVIGCDAARDVRARFERAGFARYGLLDRGSYQVLADPQEPALFAALTTMASELTGRVLGISEARVVRLGPGDYLLAHHDRLHDDHPVELTLDLSPVSVPGAEVHYRRRGQVYFRVPSMPGSCAVVERGPTVMCNHTYVSKLHTSADVMRLVVLLHVSGARPISATAR